MSAILAKLKPWASAKRRIVMGSNQQVLAWAEHVRAHHNLNASQYDVLRVVATHMGRDAWDDMRLCIAWVVERVSWSRSTVERALAFLRSIFVLRQDGEIAVKRGRPVVRYRLGSTPECPLPWHVVEARETAGQDRNDVYNSSTGPSVLVQDQGETPDTPSISPTAGASIYRSAEPIKTGPHEKVGAARRATNLRRARSLAAALLERRGARVPAPAPRVSQDGCGGFAGASSEAAVTYCHRKTEGAAVSPFTSPAFGNLPRDTRLLYLGLVHIRTTQQDTNLDPRFLKGQIFPYDDDITPDVITDMLHQLGALASVGIPAAPAKRTRAKTPLEDPWFAAFWELYPRRTGKGAARKAYVTAVSGGVSPQAINDAAASYAQRCQALQKEPQFIPHPATWLNQERWDDDVEQAPRVRSKVDVALESGMDLVNFYQQQEAIPFESQKELGW